MPAMFDVKPYNWSDFDFSLLKTTIDLSQYKPAQKFLLEPSFSESYSVLPVKSFSETAKYEIKERAYSELETQAELVKDLEVELARLGATKQEIKPAPGRGARPKKIKLNLPKPLQAPLIDDSSIKKSIEIPFVPEIGDFVKLIKSGQDKSRTVADYFKKGREYTFVPASREVELLAAQELGGSAADGQIAFGWGVLEGRYRFLVKAASILAAAAFVFAFTQGLQIKKSVTQRGQSAYTNLDNAKQAILNLDFQEATKEFSLASENFNKISGELSTGVASILSIVDLFTSSDKFSSAKNLSEAGKLLSDAGTQLSSALTQINKTNLISLAAGNNQDESAIKFLSQFNLALIGADRNLSKAQRLLASVESDILPLEKQQSFNEFKSKIPELAGFVAQSIEYTNLLSDILGASNKMRYLVMFANSSELRPAGGFAGTYAFVEFDKGKMTKYFVDDIYNPDGYFKEKIIPPKPLQKITPNWGLRDSLWWADFPTSAKKAAEFYFKINGIPLDGVIVLNSDATLRLLDVVGPIKLDKYNLTFDSGNFLDEVQNEVEYGPNRNQPKTVLSDFAPIFLAKLQTIPESRWLDIFSALVDSTQDKSLLAYFADKRLQRFALDNGISGRLEDVSGDYLMVVHSNVMGSKTDRMIDNEISLDAALAGDSLEHNLRISRKHNGGSSKYGFYNRKNPDYVRVYIPRDAEFLGISGNSDFKSAPLADYKKEGFKSDPELAAYESKMSKQQGIDVWDEGDKKVLGFWMVTEPGENSEVNIKYSTSLDTKEYKLFVQKQPGAKSKFSFEFGFGGKRVLAKYPELLNVVGSRALIDLNLDSDKNIVLEFK